MSQKNLVKILSISITIALLAFGLSQSDFQAIQVQNNQLSTQQAGSCAGNVCHRVQIDNLIFDDDGSGYLATSADEAGLGSSVCNVFNHGHFGKIIYFARDNDELYTTLLAHKLSHLPVSFGVQSRYYGSSNTYMCEIAWLDAPRQ